MIRFTEFLVAHGPMLLIGATALLAAGALALLLQRSPIHRQRVAEMTVLCVVVWLVLACVPMQRWSPKSSPSHQTRASSPSLAPVSSETADLPSDWQSVLASLTRPAQSTPQRLADRVLPDVGAARAASSQITTLTPVRAATSPGFWRVYTDRVLVWGYVAGAGSCAAWLLLGHVLLWRVTRRAKRPERWLSELFRGACEAVGVRRARVLVVSAPLRPVSCGLLRPTVLLGTDDCSAENRPRLRQVLLHESAHLRQRDAWGNALFNLAMPLLYFHPLYWILRSRASLAREMVADDIAASSTSRAAYAADLLELARLRSGHRPAPLAAVGIFRSPSHFYRRMHMLMQRNIRLDSRCSTAWKLAGSAAFVGALFAASATLGVRSARAQETPKPTEIKLEKLDQSLLQAKAARNEALAKRDAFIRQVKAGATPPQLEAELKKNAAEANQLEVELQVARNKYGEKAPQVSDLAIRLQAVRDVENKQLDADRRQLLATQKADLDSRVALAQKNLDDVQAAQQSVKAAAQDDDSTKPLDPPLSDREERSIRRRAELQVTQAREQAAKAEQDANEARGSAAESEKLRQVLESQLKLSEAQIAQLTAQVHQMQAQMKTATAQAQQEIDRAHKMLKEQADKINQNFKAGTDQVRQKIDRAILDKLQNMGPDEIKRGDLEEQVRRTYLDMAGRLPTPDERNATADLLKRYPEKFPRKAKDPARDGESNKAGGSAQLNAAVGGLRPQLDLVALANSYADAAGNVAAAREELNVADRDPHQTAAAKGKLVAAEQKARLLRSIAEAALQQAKQEYEYARKRMEAGVAPVNDGAEAEGRMRILSLILQSSADGKASDAGRD